MEYRPLVDELAAETHHVQELHRLLIAELDVVSGRSTAALSARTGGELSARWERDVAVHRWSERVRAASCGPLRALLRPARRPTTGRPCYVGRIGLVRPTTTRLALHGLARTRVPTVLLRDPRHPDGIDAPPPFPARRDRPRRARRRHSTTTSSTGAAPTLRTAADPALLAALSAPRGSAMRDIVPTIQAEQDAVIRLPLAGTVVVEGGPGTGKTAVALHRVAYLLYTHRDRLARRGVLVVGPSGPFLDYVGGVLPSLGESAVVFTTPGRLHHGVDATAVDAPAVARVKGDLAMCAVLRKAVAAEHDPARPADPDRARRRRRWRSTGRSATQARQARARSAAARTTAPGWSFAESVGRPARRPGRRIDHRRGTGRPGRSRLRQAARARRRIRRSEPGRVRRRHRPRLWPTTCATSWSTDPGFRAALRTSCGRCAPRSGCSRTCSAPRTGSA